MDYTPTKSKKRSKAGQDRVSLVNSIDYNNEETGSKPSRKHNQSID